MLVGLIILALIVIGLCVAFAALTAFVMLWILMIVFGVSAVLLGLLVKDPYLGFFLAFPATGLIFWLISLSSQKPSDSKSP